MRFGPLAQGHDGPVTHVAFAAQTNLALSAGEDGRIKIWDGTTGEEVRTIAGHTRPVRWAFFCNEDTEVVSASLDSTVRLWRVDSGTERRYVRVPHPLHAGAIAPGGRLLAAASPREEHLRLLPLTEDQLPPRLLPQRADGMVLALAFSPDGALLASAGGLHNFLQVHDVATGRVIVEASSLPFAVHGLSWAPDGASIFLGGHDVLARWSLVKRRVVARVGGHGEFTRGLAVEAAGDVVFFGGGSAVHGWNPTSDCRAFHARAHLDSVVSTALSPDGRTLVSGSHDASVRFWGVGPP